jgi:hypothetical protein
MKRRSAREEAEMLDFTSGSPHRERRQRTVVERMVSGVASLFEPPLTGEETRRLKDQRGGR